MRRSSLSTLVNPRRLQQVAIGLAGLFAVGIAAATLPPESHVVAASTIQVIAQTFMGH